MKPMIIVLEGADGAGKSTLSQHLSNALKKMGFKCRTASFPGKTHGSIGELVYKIHHDHKREGIIKISSTSLQALHIAAHIDFLERIKKDPRSILILDRSWWSTLVYGEISRANPKVIKALVDAEKILWGEYRSVVVLVTGVTEGANSKATKRLVTKYNYLARQEQNKYPIIRHLNTIPVEVSAQNLLDALLPHIQS